MEISARVTPWVGPEIPTEAAIRRVMDAEGLRYERWANGPLDVYFAHSHPYHKIIYVVAGAITFILPQNGSRFTLQVGDRLNLPAGTIHEAVVSTLGVECFEAHYD
ncbi:MAG: cupin domain-containing protein [Anaerolineales bacterium]